MLIALVVIIAIVILLFLPVKILASYTDKNAAVQVFLAGIPIWKLRKKEKNNTEKANVEEKVKKTEKSAQRLGSKIKFYADLSKTTVKLTRKFVRIIDLKVKTEIGTGDAPTTAISTGIMWGAIYGLIGVIGGVIPVKKHNVEITPVYNNTTFCINGKCIIKSRIAYIIVIAITFLIKFKSGKGKEE